MAEVKYNASLSQGARGFVKFRRQLYDALSQKDQRIITGGQEPPELEATDERLEKCEKQISEFADERLFDEENPPSAEETQRYQMLLATQKSLLEARARAEKKGEEFRAAADAAWTWIQAHSGSTVQAIFENHKAKGNRLRMVRKGLHEMTKTFEGNPYVVREAIMGDLRSLEPATTKEELLALYVKMGLLRLEMANHAEDNEVAIGAGKLLAPMSDIEAVQMLRTKVATDEEDVKWMADGLMQERKDELTWKQVETRYFCRQDVDRLCSDTVQVGSW
jgi:hypothetical protein